MLIARPYESCIAHPYESFKNKCTSFEGRVGGANTHIFLHDS